MVTASVRLRLAVVLMVLIAWPGTAPAELGRDVRIQESGEIRIEVSRQVLEEFARLFDLGYPPATVMMHAISTGMSVNDILYIAVKSDPSRSREFYDTAESLLPVLPGWVCQADTDRQRYTREVDLSRLEDDPSVRRIADLFIEADRRVVPFPDWTEGRVHMEASVRELIELAGDARWYVPGEDDGTAMTVPDRPVFVSVYKHSGEIVVDRSVERLRRARERGEDRLPVVLVYNDALQRSFAGFDRDATVGELAERFYDEGIELTAVPEWRVGDHHLAATVAELREVVDIPEREDIPEQRWAALEEAIRANGMAVPQPLLLTLVRSGPGRAWIDDPATAAVAAELGVETLPVVLFYHRLDRRACGQPSDCGTRLCEAAVAAGAPREICRSEQQAAGAGGGAGPSERPVASRMDLRVYEGLSYTQNRCSS